jgi:hypothetical protein
MSGENGQKKKRNLSPETRQKLSAAAKQRHAEGRLGGAKFGRLGGRPRKDRAASKVAAEAQKEATRIIQVFKDATDPSQPISVRLKAAQAWVEIEREESKLMLAEDSADAKQMSREELIAAIREKFSSGAAAAILQKAIESGDRPEVITIDDDDIIEEDDGDGTN